MKRKKVAIIGTNGIPARYGGFETLAHYLTKELSNDFDFTVYCSSIYKKEERLKEYHGARLIYLPLNANGIQSIIYDFLSTIHAYYTADTLLILGPAAGLTLIFNKIFRKNIIVNHGGLNEWEREKFSLLQKKIAYINHGIAARFASINIADNEPLQESILKTFGENSEVIAYGGNHIKSEFIQEKHEQIYPFLRNSYDLSISRAQEDNNLHVLLETYEQLTQRNLVLISNWEISEYGKQLKLKYQNKYINISILDALYDEELLNVIRSNAALYIHSHSRCGTAPSLVEAMHYNVPTICFDVPTNRLTTQNKTKYFLNKLELMTILKELSSDERLKITKNLNKIAFENFNWKIISNRYSKLF